jgi:hypothetical protein
MKYIFLFVLIGLTSCFPLTSNRFDKDYYEKSTGIIFPRDYKVVTSFDNGEFMTITILDLNKSDCKKFIDDNKFKSTENIDSLPLYSPPNLSGLAWLDSCYGELPDKNLLANEKSFPNGTGWTYYIDTTTCRLYCQINYPDWAAK